MSKELKAYSVVASSETQNYINGETNLAFEAYDADEVDALLAEKDEEIRKNRRAMWLARAWFCGRSSEYFSGMASRCKIGQEDFYREVSERARRYLKSSYKCRAKMEEYK